MESRNIRWLALSLAAFWACAPASAQIERVAPKTPEKRPAKSTPRKHEAPAAVAAPGESGPALVGVKIVRSRDEVKGAGEVAVSGVVIGPGRELDLLRGSDFAGLITSYIGKPLTQGAIASLQRDIVRYYRDQGRPLLDVVFPAQESVGKGVLQIFILEAMLGKIEVEGNKWTKQSLITSNVRVRDNETIDTERLLQDVDWLNQNPGRQVDVAFRPGAQAGQSDIVLRVNEHPRPVRVFVGYENSGPQFTGEDRVFGGFNWFNAFGLDHRLNYQFTTDTEFDFTKAHSVSYEVPLPWRHTLAIYGGYIDSKADFATPLFNQEGTSYQVSFRYEIPLHKWGRLSHSVGAGFDFKSFDNNLEFGGVPIFGTAVDIAQFAMFYKGTVPDKWGSTGFRLETFLSPGGIGGDNDDASFLGQRAFSSSSYAYARLNAQRDTRLPGGWLWTVRGALQASDGNLQGSEQFGLGGMGTIRGYDDREANGDRGWMISTEIMTPALPVLRLLDKDAPDGLHLLGFWDHGEARIADELPAQDPNLILSSLGLGLRYNYSRYLSLRFDYGWQLRDSGPTNPHTGDSSRGHISVQLSF
jgi:hemolysin activation/secretion protein